VKAVQWRSRLASSLPFYYGWAIIACTVPLSFSTRTIMAVATLSVFVVPMTEDLGWSRGLFSGAVSLGGLCAVLVSPLVGTWIDRYGSGMLLAASSVVTGILAIGLSLVSSPLAFYSLYVPGRMIFSGPLELGIPTAISNWFIRRRPLGLAADGVAKGAGLAFMPLAAQFIITGWDWRTAWFTLGILTFALGVVPPLLFMVRRPEDMALEPDPVLKGNVKSPGGAQGVESLSGESQSTVGFSESSFTVRQALNTRAFWLLAAFSAGGFMVQAGVSLHQVAHYIGQGLSGPSAALTASTFAFSQIFGSVFWSALGRQVPVRFLLSATAFVVAIAVLVTSVSSSLPAALLAAATVGFGVGGLHLLVRLAWADYYGREHLGAIRGYTMSAQVGGQAIGPIFAGLMFDGTGSYQAPFLVLALVASLAGLMVIFATPPNLKAGAPVSAV
jgi:MFS family permease